MCVGAAIGALASPATGGLLGLGRASQALGLSGPKIPEVPRMTSSPTPSGPDAREQSAGTKQRIRSRQRTAARMGTAQLRFPRSGINPS
jgi:hypothetical protein